MIRLVIGNSLCQILGLNPNQFNELKNVLSYKVDNRKSYFGGGWKNPIRYLIDKKGNFPTGLLYLVEEWLKNKENSRADQRAKPKKNSTPLYMVGDSLSLQPYPEQLEAVEAAHSEGNGIIAMPTGFGKSITMALLIKRMGLKTLVIVPNLELKQQLKATFKSMFGPNYQSTITIENIDSSRLLKETNYDCLIIDEAHHAAAKTYRVLNRKAWTGIYHRFFFTATPFRSKTEEQLLMESITGRPIYSIDHKTSVEKGYIVPLEAYYVELPKQEMEGNESSWASVYNELVVNNEVRNDIVADVLANLEAAGTPVLCLVKEIKHGEALSAATGIPFANGQADNTRELILEFNLGERKALIGTVGVLGEGVDTKPAEWVILAGGGKSPIQFMQNCGRAFRKYPGKESAKVLLFKDPSHKFLLTHFKENVRVLKEKYGIAPVKLEVE